MNRFNQSLWSTGQHGMLLTFLSFAEYFRQFLLVGERKKLCIFKQREYLPSNNCSTPRDRVSWKLERMECPNQGRGHLFRQLHLKKRYPCSQSQCMSLLVKSAKDIIERRFLLCCYEKHQERKFATCRQWSIFS